MIVGNRKGAREREEEREKVKGRGREEGKREEGMRRE